MVARPADRESLLADVSHRLAARPEIEFAVLHGSFLDRGRARDVDIAVWLDPSRQAADRWPRYALDLAATLTVALGVSVDVQILNGAPLAFRYHALKGAPLVVRTSDFFDDVRARTWDEYFDFLPFARQYAREVLSE
jgi:predicted nucleotidyltransferase